MAEKRVNQERRYLSYLLRLWQETSGSQQGGAPLWRASLERPQSDVRQGFAGLVDLFAFLESETGSGSAGPEGSDEGDVRSAKESEPQGGDVHRPD